jgi:hypothetical protein
MQKDVCRFYATIIPFYIRVLSTYGFWYLEPIPHEMVAMYGSLPEQMVVGLELATSQGPPLQQENL